MIPLGSDSEPRLVIGHNVAYDRQGTIFLPKSTDKGFFDHAILPFIDNGFSEDTWEERRNIDL